MDFSISAKLTATATTKRRMNVIKCGCGGAVFNQVHLLHVELVKMQTSSCAPDFQKPESLMGGCQLSLTEDRKALSMFCFLRPTLLPKSFVS